MLRKPHKIRVFILGGTVALLTASVIARLAHLQISDFDSYTSKANKQQTTRVIVQPERGDIFDRKGTPLATSTGTLSVFINPKFFKEAGEDADLDLMAQQVAYHGNLDRDDIRKKFAASHVVPIARQLNPEIAKKMIEVFEEHGISSRGYWYDRESKRHYVRGIAPHLVGFTGKNAYGDNRGLSGVELVYADEIDGEVVEARASRSGFAQLMQPVDQEDLLSARGYSLVLTIDSSIQSAAEEALANAGEEFEADGAGAVAMDVQTGEILAMASWPTYDNNSPGQAPDGNRRNRLLTDPFETGSVVKLLTAAMLLDQNLIEIDTPIDCGGGFAYFGSRRVSDSAGHYMDTVPFYKVIRHSSNVGTIRAAEVMDNESWYDYLSAFGMGSRTGIDLPGENSGVLYPVDKWTSYSRSSLPMGYEVSLTGMQIVTAISALVNGGVMMEPYVVSEMRDSKGNLVSKHEPVVKHRVIRPSTSYIMREIMEDVVINGTGKSAQIEGFRVGGKTGTTRKSHVFTHREYISSFGGALPIDDPRVAIYVFVDNPKGKYYGSTVAAPIFHAVAQECVLQLGLVPSLTPPVMEEEQLLDEQPNFSGRFSRDSTVTSEEIPDFKGMSMLEARHYLGKRYHNVSFQGSGLIIDQHPAPGQFADPNTEIILVFGDESRQSLSQNDNIVTEARH